MNQTASVNIAFQLSEMARRQPDAPAIWSPDGRDANGRTKFSQTTFRQLDKRSDALARGLVQRGVGAGVRAVLMVRPGPDFFALVFALLKARAVMVCIDPGMGIRNLGQCLAEAEPQAFIGVPAAHVARRLFGWGRKTIRQNVWVGKRGWLRSLIAADAANFDDGPNQAGNETAGEWPDAQPDEMAAILFTSGSTGAPKGVVYTHGTFQAQANALRNEFQIAPGEIDLCTFPLFALFAPALGMTAITPRMDFTRPGRVDPREIIEPIERFGATNMFGSPALLDRVGRWAEEKNVRLPTLRRVISAGAPAPADVLRRIAGILSNEAQAFTPYGATEALPVCSIGSREILGETAAATRQGAGVCVGQPVGDAKVRIIRICNEPIEIWTDELLVSDGAIGEIVVKGSVVTRWYFNRSESTKLAKINDADGSFYHRMGDLGRIDEQGRVWFCGRKSQRVQTADGDLFTVCCEGIFNAHPKVYRSAIVGVVRSGKNQSVLCVELESGVATRDRETIRRELLELGAKHSTTQSIRRVLFHRRFPTDIRHNAKIGREQLARWAQRRLR